MATRKIRLTLSGEKALDVGPLVDIDFDNENLDVDVDVDAVKGEATLVKEYTVDVEPGIYNLDITFKNDGVADTTGDGEIDQDRNLYIEKIEYANNGVDYQTLIVTEENSNLELWNNFEPMGYTRSGEVNPDYDETKELSQNNLNRNPTLNPDYDENLPRTDGQGWLLGTDPGSNPKFQYQFIVNPINVWDNSTATFTIEFA
jgi:hypothetical protein